MHNKLDFRANLVLPKYGFETFFNCLFSFIFYFIDRVTLCT
jgi:hypothetical protein